MCRSFLLFQNIRYSHYGLGNVNGALHVAVFLRSSFKDTSTVVNTFGVMATAFVVHRKVEPPRCGAAESGPSADAFANTLSSAFTTKSHDTSLALDTSPPSTER